MLPLAFSNNEHDWAGPPPSGDGGSWADLEPTVMAVIAIVCLALLILWWALVWRRPGL